MKKFSQIKRLNEELKENYKVFIYYIENSNNNLRNENIETINKIFEEGKFRYKESNGLLLELFNIEKKINLLKSANEKYQLDIKFLITLITIFFIISIILISSIYNYLSFTNGGIIISNIISLVIGAVNYAVAYETYKDIRYKDEENSNYKNEEQQLKKQYTDIISKIENKIWLFKFWSRQLIILNKDYSNEKMTNEINNNVDNNIQEKKYIKKRKNLL